VLTRYGNGIVLASSNIYTYVLHCTYACMLITLTLSMFGVFFFLYSMKGLHNRMAKGLAYGILSLRYIQVSLSESMFFNGTLFAFCKFLCPHDFSC
jgi:hypothetical protein